MFQSIFLKGYSGGQERGRTCGLLQRAYVEVGDLSSRTTNRLTREGCRLFRERGSGKETEVTQLWVRVFNVDP